MSKFSIPTGILESDKALELIEELREEIGSRKIGADEKPRKLKKLAGRHIDFDGELALYYLENDVKVRAKLKKPNRPLTRSNIAAKIRMLELSAFVCSAQNPTIDWNTAVIDGQHTLWAIAIYFANGSADGPVQLFIKEGENPDHFEFYDQGKSRTTADVLHIDDVDYADEIAGALRLLWIRMNGKKVSGANKMSPYELKKFGKAHMAGLKKSAKFVMGFGVDEDSVPAKSFMSPGYIIAFHYMMTKSDGGSAEIADNFWTSVIEREGEKNSAEWKLHKKFDKIKSTADMRLSRDEKVCYCIMGMYASLTEEAITWAKPIKDLYIGGLDGKFVEVEESNEDDDYEEA